MPEMPEKGEEMTHLHDLIKWAESRKRFIEAASPERTKGKLLALARLDLFIVQVQCEIGEQEDDCGKE